MVKLLAESDKPSEKEDLGIYIYVYVDGGEVVGIWSDSPIGLSEYTRDGQWKMITPSEQSRVLELQNYSQYRIDWANEKDFDEDDESITLKLYEQGKLTEDYLKNNAIFLRGPIENE